MTTFLLLLSSNIGKVAELWTLPSSGTVQHCQTSLISPCQRTPATPTRVETSPFAAQLRRSWPALASPATWARPRIADSAPTTQSVPPTQYAKGEL